MNQDTQLVATIKSLALAEGFARVGIAPAGAVPTADRYDQWLAKGWHADMTYLARNMDQRRRPDVLVPGAKSVICLAVRYEPPAKENFRLTIDDCRLNDDLPTALPFNRKSSIENRQSQPSLVAAYAQGKDYHKVLKKRCMRLMDRIRDLRPDFAGRAFADSAPIMERSLAVLAGLGSVGRNGCLAAPGLGSYVVLCEIVCNLALPCDQPISSQCADCGRCVAACPTAAIGTDGLIDARRCINYLTIENRGPIDPEYWPRIGTRVFGCDACQQACPLNKDTMPTGEAMLGTGPALKGASLGDILKWRLEDWDAATRGSSTRRATYDMFIRNAIIAAGNSGNPELAEQLCNLRGTHAGFGNIIEWAIARLQRE